jgi:hypothetical protein
MDLSAVLKNQSSLFGFMKFLKEENALNQLQFCLSVGEFWFPIDFHFMVLSVTCFFGLKNVSDSTVKVLLYSRIEELKKQSRQGTLNRGSVH